MENNDEKYRIIKSALEKIGAIKLCHCGDYYWTLKCDSSVYAMCFANLKKRNISIDNSFVKSTIKQILDAGGCAGWVCPHCGWNGR